jgi:hypothetical protein
MHCRVNLVRVFGGERLGRDGFNEFFVLWTRSEEWEGAHGRDLTSSTGSSLDGKRPRGTARLLASSALNMLRPWSAKREGTCRGAYAGWMAATASKLESAPTSVATFPPNKQ